jgi:hypothetical protein
VDPEPIQVVEGSTPDGVPLLGVVAGATRLADGTIVVGDASGTALKFFDVEGRLTRTVGRQGEAPGEFQYLGWVKRCARDSLFVFDVFPRRISVFSASGGFVRRFDLPGMPGLVACSEHGVVAFLKGDQPMQPPEGVELWQQTAPLAVADTRGTVTRELGRVLAGEIGWSGSGWGLRPAGLAPSIAVARDRVFACPTETGAVAAYGLDGARPRSIALRVPRRAVMPRDLERWVDAHLPIGPGGVAFQRTWRQRLLRIPAPEHLPPCSGILADPDDNVWVVLSVLGDSVTTLRVFGRDDRVLGDVTVPAALKVLEIGSDYLLASGESADGEPWVRVYRVRRTASR